MSGNKFKTNGSTNKWFNNLTNKLSKSVIWLEILNHDSLGNSVCAVLKNVLAKTQKVISKNKEKGHFGPILDHLCGPITQPKAIFKKKSFKGTPMAISILFRGNL